MGKSLSMDLRRRALAAVDAGMSRRGAAGRFGVSVLSVIRWDVQRRETGGFAPKPQGGDTRSRRIETQHAEVNREIAMETEVFVFGGLCVMAEGRCALSSYATGQSPNMNGVCSPASHVAYAEEGEALVARLGGYTIQKSAPGAPAPYPTLCKGCFSAGGSTGHLFEDPVSLDATELVPRLAAAGVTALKIEGRQRSRAYVSAVVAGFRRAVDALAEGRPIPPSALAALTEGQSSTVGAYAKIWR